MYLAKHPENLNNFNLSRPRYRSATPISHGMVATGNHIDYGFAAGRTTPKGRASARQTEIGKEVKVDT